MRPIIPLRMTRGLVTLQSKKRGMNLDKFWPIFINVSLFDFQERGAQCFLKFFVPGTGEASARGLFHSQVKASQSNGTVKRVKTTTYLDLKNFKIIMF